MAVQKSSHSFVNSLLDLGFDCNLLTNREELHVTLGELSCSVTKCQRKVCLALELQITWDYQCVSKWRTRRSGKATFLGNSWARFITFLSLYSFIYHSFIHSNTDGLGDSLIHLFLHQQTGWLVDWLGEWIIELSTYYFILYQVVYACIHPVSHFGNQPILKVSDKELESQSVSRAHSPMN